MGCFQSRHKSEEIIQMRRKSTPPMNRASKKERKKLMAQYYENTASSSICEDEQNKPVRPSKKHQGDKKEVKINVVSNPIQRQNSKVVLPKGMALPDDQNVRRYTREGAIPKADFSSMNLPPKADFNSVNLPPLPTAPRRKLPPIPDVSTMETPPFGICGIPKRRGPIESSKALMSMATSDRILGIRRCFDDDLRPAMASGIQAVGNAIISGSSKMMPMESPVNLMHTGNFDKWVRRNLRQ